MSAKSPRNPPVDMAAKKTLLTVAVSSVGLVLARAGPASAGTAVTPTTRPCPGPDQYYSDPNNAVIALRGAPRGRHIGGTAVR
ncbi:hypothetical protein ACI1MP_34100 [Kitasatospora griseola]|uniref:hypothetical protein n=1 Tax=Kitasatospora griseola TaxID=2064 RepID=UPI003855BBB6